MTPDRLDWPSLQRKLDVVREVLAELRTLGGVDLARLEEDFLVRRTVERDLTMLVDLAVAVNTQVVVAVADYAPDNYRASFTAAAKLGLIDKDLAASLGLSTGLRNVLVHQYVDTDPGRVVAAVPLALTEYGEYLRQASRWVEQHAGEE